MKQTTRRSRLPLRGLLLTLVVMILLTLLGVFNLAELSAINAAFNLRGPRTPEAPVVIVAVDQESFDQTGFQWPWPRDYIAGIVESISAGDPKVIVLDAFFYEPDQRAGGDSVLAAAIQQAGNVVVVNDIQERTEAGFSLTQLRTPIPEISESARVTGLANFDRDADAFVRRMLLWQRHQGQVHYSWSYQAAALYLGVSPDPLPTATAIRLGEEGIPLTGQRMVINFQGPSRTFPHYPAYQVENGEIPASTFTGKIVIFGATDESLHDTYPTPFEGTRLPMPGAEINAHVINTLLAGNFIRPAGRLIGLLLVIFMSLFGFLVSRLRRALLAVVATFGSMLLYALVWFGLFVLLRVEIDVVAPVIALALGAFGPTIERALSEELEKRRVRNIFERFISPPMVQQLIETRDINSLNKRTNLTILFSDIRGFTTMSEKMDPDSLVRLLNEYLAVMTEVVHKHGGTVDKYEGDAILAFFGEPIPYSDHALRAAAAALEMRSALDQLRQKWAGGGGPKRFEIGIGLNSGDVFVGLIGSEKRVNYTVIGDNVNLAARLQDLTKELDWPILISGMTHEQINEEFEDEFAESRLVKGKTEPVAIYKVLGRKGAPESERVRPLFS